MSTELLQKAVNKQSLHDANKINSEVPPGYRANQFILKSTK